MCSSDLVKERANSVHQTPPAGTDQQPPEPPTTPEPPAPPEPPQPPQDEDILIELDNKELFGLKIGDALPKEIISSWQEEEGQNYTIEYYNYTWTRGFVPYDTNRKIKRFYLVRGVPAFSVSDTDVVYLKAEGFKEYMDSRKPKAKKEKPKKERKKKEPSAKEQEIINKLRNIEF